MLVSLRLLFSFLLNSWITAFNFSGRKLHWNCKLLMEIMWIDTPARFDVHLFFSLSYLFRVTYKSQKSWMSVKTFFPDFLLQQIIYICLILRLLRSLVIDTECCNEAVLWRLEKSMFLISKNWSFLCHKLDLVLERDHVSSVISPCPRQIFIYPGMP